MSRGQWDTLLAAAYDAGAVLVEVDADDRPVRAYQQTASTRGSAP